MVVFQKWLYLDKVVVFGQSGCIRAKVVVFGQKLYSGKVVVFWQKWLYSGKVVVLGEKGCIRVNWLYSGSVVSGRNVVRASGFIREKGVVLAKVVVSIRARCFYSDKSGCTRAKWMYSG